MSKMSASEMIDKWGRRMKASTEDMKRGIERVDVAPGVSAAKQQGLMLAKLTEALTNGSWAKAVSAVSLEDWKNSALRKGLQRVAAGVDGAMPNMGPAITKLLSDLDAVAAEVNRIPRGTLEDNINRMTTQVRGMAARKGK